MNALKPALIHHSQDVSGANVLLETLSQNGVKFIFSVPGREAESVLFNEVFGLEFVLTAVEFTAGFSAYGYALLTNKPQAVFSTIGPGSANLANAIYSARADRVPILFVAAQVERGRQHHNHTHQCLDTVSIYKPIAKYVYEINDVVEIKEVATAAINAANTEPKGPAVISIPIDILKEQYIRSDGSLWMQEPHVSTLQPKDNFEKVTLEVDLIEQAADILRNSQQPLVYAGHEVIRSGSVEKVRKLCQMFQIPLVTAYDAQGILPANDELNYFACTSYAEGILGINPDELIFGPADCIIAFGYDWKDDVFPDKHFHLGQPKRLVNFSGFYPQEFKDYFLQIGGDLKDSLQLFMDKLLINPPSFKAPYNIAPITQAIIEKRGHSDAPKEEVSIVSVMNIINEFSPILISDVGTFRHYAITLGIFNKPNQFLTSAGSSSFGIGLPLGLGAYLANQQKDLKVVVLVGDGGFNSCVGDLRTLKRLDASIVIIVLNNNQNGLIGIYQKKGHKRNYGPAFIHEKADFRKVAEGYGCFASRVLSEDQLRHGLKSAFDKHGPVVIEVPIYYPEEDVERLSKSSSLA